MGKYVEKHMWDDNNEYDVFESTYRESYNDIEDNSNNNNRVVNFNLMNKITNFPNTIISAGVAFGTKYFNFDPKITRTFMAAFVVAITPITFLYFLLSTGGIFRKLLMKRETKRYGTVSDLSAEEKEETFEDIDEDDDEEDDDDDDDDDDKE